MLKKTYLQLGILIGGLMLVSLAHAQNTKSCCVGVLPNGEYHIACAQPAMGGMGILQNMRARNITCTPDNYSAIGKKLCANKKDLSWTTNVLNAPTSCEDIH